MKLIKGQPIWLIKGDGTVRRGFFQRYVGHMRARIYLTNDGYYTVPIGILKPRKMLAAA